MSQQSGFWSSGVRAANAVRSQPKVFLSSIRGLYEDQLRNYLAKYYKDETKVKVYARYKGRDMAERIAWVRSAVDKWADAHTLMRRTYEKLWPNLTEIMKDGLIYFEDVGLNLATGETYRVVNAVFPCQFECCSIMNRQAASLLDGLKAMREREQHRVDIQNMRINFTFISYTDHNPQKGSWETFRCNVYNPNRNLAQFNVINPFVSEESGARFRFYCRISQKWERALLKKPNKITPKKKKKKKKSKRRRRLFKVSDSEVPKSKKKRRKKHKIIDSDDDSDDEEVVFECD